MEEGCLSSLPIDVKIEDAQATVERLVEMKERERLLAKHHHKIYQSQGYYVTYLNRKTRMCARTEEALKNKLVRYYRDLEKKHPLKNVFECWMNEREEYHEIKEQSITRMRNTFKRYFENSKDPIMKKDIGKITEGDITRFLKQTIVEFNMSHKGYADLRTIIRGMWRYARDQGWTDLKIVEYFHEVYLPKGMFRKIVPKDGKEVYTDEEIEKLKGEIIKSDNIVDWGFLLQFQTGMRIGELCTLKPSDISPKYIHVQRTEIHYTSSNGHDVKTVQETTKTEAGNRYIILTQNSLEVVRKILTLSNHKEFVFERKNGTRISEACFNRRLRVLCNRVGIPFRSTHKIRKSYASTLINKQVDESLIAEQMGHSDIATTRKYYYFANQTEDEKFEQISKAITI